MLIDVFEQVPLFEGLSADELSLLRTLFVPCEYEADTMIFDQGDPAEFLYLVISGEVVVNFKPDDGPAITVARVQPGGIVGWSAALGSRSYTSRGECPVFTRLLRVRGMDLRKLCERYPQTGALVVDRLATVIAQRLSNTHDQVVALLHNGLLNGINNNNGG